MRHATLPVKLASESQLLLGLRRACCGCAAAVCMRGVELIEGGGAWLGVLARGLVCLCVFVGEKGEHGKALGVRACMSCVLPELAC